MKNSEKEVGSVNGGYPHAKHEANAHLIAAAPELYAALANVMQWIMAWDVAFQDDDEWKPDRDAAYAALAKARGEAV